MSEQNENVGREVTEMIDWQQLENFSKEYAEGATILSTRLKLVQERLSELPGLFECKVDIGGAQRFIKFGRMSNVWTLMIVRDKTRWIRLEQMRVDEKAKLATGLPNLLRHMFDEAQRRAKLVADGLALLEEAESLIGLDKGGE